ncbi:class I SAM-dependent methyltransferase [Kitasatospora kifunensis]|uniref:Ubiquinone/menaquinone biosynthesis C-methylase UbiE n=1 Tax=Kitasatospora kifunensis TaxID=58351 RepID=A0A7W7VTR7_KITKI|nr:class I SAM-dependent methyltransferase [Kitasatospora kifunensis]MBB4922542.1 ubiquinone/menaquinone biosynthesis C-methylase UbiE [Kitasatospora kifunensis]
MPRNPQSFDHVAEEYERLHELVGDPVGEWLPKVLPATGGRALDIGCGGGRHAVVLAEHYREVDAIDVSGPMIELARRKRPRANVSYRAGDLLDTTGPYDFVLSAATLHHVPDLGAALRHVRSLVAPGGRAVLIDTVSPRAATPRWWLYCGSVRKLAQHVVARGPGVAWEIFRLSTGDWLEHRASDRYLSREGFDHAYGTVFPKARFQPVGRAQGMVWDAPGE